MPGSALVGNFVGATEDSQRMFCTGNWDYCEGSDEAVGCFVADDFGCDGNIIITDSGTGLYSEPGDNNGVKINPANYYRASGNICEYLNGAWSSLPGCDKISGSPSASSNNLFIGF
jgi:hypothetical protein